MTDGGLFGPGLGGKDITPLREDLSNLAMVGEEVNQKLLAVNQELANMGEGQDIVALEQRKEYLEGAAQALQVLQESSAAMQEQGLFGTDTEQLGQPDLSESGLNPENFIMVQEAAMSAKEALSELQAEAAALASERFATEELLSMAEAADKSGQTMQQMPAKLQAYINSNNLVGKSNQDVVKSLKDKKAGLDNDAKALKDSATKQLTNWNALKNALKPGAEGKVKLDAAQFHVETGQTVGEFLHAAGIIEAGATGWFDADGTPLMAEADEAIAILEALIAELETA